MGEPLLLCSPHSVNLQVLHVNVELTLFKID